MSLTRLLAVKEVRRLFRESFEFRPADVAAPLRAPPATTNYSLVGTAFDYLARFWLERHHDIADKRRWVAEDVAMNLSVQCGEYVKAAAGDDAVIIPREVYESRGSESLPDGRSWAVFADDSAAVTPTAAGAARAAVVSAKAAAAAYVRSGEVDDGLFRSALRLAGLDFVFRSGRTDRVRTAVDGRDVEDLRRLWDVMEDGDLRRLDGPIWLNPTFGRASEMVGGADADFIAGDRLGEGRTTKNGRFTRDHFDQLAGYCVLDCLGDRRGAHRKPPGAMLVRAGIYFARHGALMTVDADAIYGAPAFDGFLAAFAGLAGRHAARPACPPA